MALGQADRPVLAARLLGKIDALVGGSSMDPAQAGSLATSSPSSGRQDDLGLCTRRPATGLQIRSPNLTVA